METASKKRIVIIGGGFAGISAYRALRPHCGREFDILLVSDNKEFTHIPLIHEVATGALPSSVVSWPLERYVDCPSSELLFGRAVSVDADKREVAVDRAGERVILPFDYLVVATGSKPSLPDVPGATEHLLHLRTLGDAQKIHEIIFKRFAEARKTDDAEERKKLLTFVCLGAGVTGIELVGELSNLFSNEIARQYPDLRGLARIMLINDRENISLGGQPWFGEKAKKRLRRLPCVEVFFAMHTIAVSDEGVQTNRGFIASRTVIWTGGVTGAPVATVTQPPVAHDTRGRMTVVPELYLAGHQNIFVVGDAASISKRDGSTYGMQAQFAVREGRHAGKNILRSMRGETLVPFETKQRGFLIPIGKHYGLAEIFGFKFSGPLAWHAVHIIYVFSVVRWDLKLQVAWKWLYHLMRSRKTL